MDSIYSIVFHNKTGLIQLFLYHVGDQKMNAYRSKMIRLIPIFYPQKIQSNPMFYLERLVYEIFQYAESNNPMYRFPLTMDVFYSMIEDVGGLLLSERLKCILSHMTVSDSSLTISSALFNNYLISYLSEEFDVSFDYIWIHLCLLKHHLHRIFTQPYRFQNLILVSEGFQSENRNPEMDPLILDFFGTKKRNVIRYTYAIFSYLPKQEKLSFTFLSHSPIIDFIININAETELFS